MAKLLGHANTATELVKGLVGFLTDPATFGAGNEWKMLRPTLISDINEASEIILQGVGDGQDTIFIGIKLKVNGSQTDLIFNGFAGYDAALEWWEQPGGINDITRPALPVINETYTTYWITATTSRFIIIVENSTQYEGAYCGLFQPVAVERQYPYPLMIAGSITDGVAWTDVTDAHSLFTNPLGSDAKSTIRIRRPDGTWRSGSNSTVNGPLNVWPTITKPVNTLTVYDPNLTLENVVLYPFMLQESNPVGMIGQIDGVYWIGNREDVSAKDTIVYNDKQYKVFNNVFRRDNDQYFAIAWD